MNKVAFFIVLIVLKGVALLPLPLLRMIAKGLGTVFFYASKKTRHKVISNLTQAALLRHVSPKTVIQQLVISGFEMIWVWFNSAQTIAKKITVDEDCQSLINCLLDKNNQTPRLLLTPHLGCFEALAKWITTQTALTAMYRRPKQAFVVL
jgi:KDO2-lipid IV(A) lauroyltransferase